MPWNVRDYPASMKNLDPLVRKKAIDIANALLADGYSDDRAIPIATSQAEKWQVRSKGAKRASDHFDKKAEAIARAKEIAENKESVVNVYKKDGDHQKDIDLGE